MDTDNNYNKNMLKDSLIIYLLFLHETSSFSLF